MPLIEWNEKFSVGVPAVDHEHRELITLINAMHEQLMRPESADAAVDFLGEIYAQISAHFALEERLMREARYQGYTEHKVDHERLLEEIRDIMDDVEDQGVFNEAQLAERLHRWFTEHFRTHDARWHKSLD